MPLRLFVARRVAWVKGLSTVNTGSGFCGSAGRAVMLLTSPKGC